MNERIIKVDGIEIPYAPGDPKKRPVMYISNVAVRVCYVKASNNFFLTYDDNWRRWSRYLDFTIGRACLKSRRFPKMLKRVEE